MVEGNCVEQGMCGDNRKTKLLILGLDGLEHKLVLQWDLKKLQQHFRGEFYVGGISRIYTPLVWSSILCGFNVEEKGYDFETAARTSMGKLGLLHVIKKHIFGVEDRSWRARKLLRKLGLLEPPRYIMPEKLLKETFLEKMIELGYCVFALEVPGYNERVNGVFRLKGAEIAISKTIKPKKSFVEEVKKDAVRRLAETRKALDNYDLVMCYLPLPDLAHHFFFKGVKGRIRILTLYKWLEKNVDEIVLEHAYKLGFQAMILSDHGFDMKIYDHSKYGFWSTTFQTEIKTYEDIKSCVLNLLQA